MNAPGSAWRRITTCDEFRRLFVDRRLTGDDLNFTIHADGRITGDLGGTKFTGQWVWRGVYFCRSAQLDGRELPDDCEVIETDGTDMRYVRDRGRGEASIVSIA